MNFSNDTSNKEGFHLMPSRRAIIRGIATTALFTLAGTNVYAETFPTKPVRILVPYAAGGAVDVLARTLGQSLSKTWGQQPVIENRPGAGGIIASQALTQSAPDGYTLILVASGHPLNQFFYPKLPYDTFKDFTAISEIAYSPLAIVVSKSSPIKHLQELLATAREKPESLSYGMSGLQGRRPCADRRHRRRDSDERQSAARGGRPTRRQRGARACGDNGAALEDIARRPHSRGSRPARL
jgi:hypothetical protein